VTVSLPLLRPTSGATKNPNGESSPLKACVSPGPGENRNGNARLLPRPGGVLIRIVKSPPAPLMDGFDVRGLRVDQVYDMDDRLGRYVVIAGYAERLDETALGDLEPKADERCLSRNNR
jgi:hypothetical protein